MRLRALPTYQTTSTPVLWVLDDLSDALDVHHLLRSLRRPDHDVYFMRHRGLQPTASVFNTTHCRHLAASIDNSTTSQNELTLLGQQCATSVQDQIGSLESLAAFSTMSAALDVASFITAFQQTRPVFVYGSNMATLLVRRLMQNRNLTDRISGFLLDSMLLTTLSLHDQAFHAVVQSAFFSPCLLNTSAVCYHKFPPSFTIVDALSELVDDKSSVNACVQRLQTTLGAQDQPAQAVIRRFLSRLVRQRYAHTLVPAMIYRLYHCRPSDLKAFDDTEVVTQLVEDCDHFLVPNDPLALMVQHLILFSELLDQPLAPNNKTLLLSDDAIQKRSSVACAFRQDCQESSNVSLVYETTNWNWEVDQTVVKNASVVVFSSRLNPMAPLNHSLAFVNQLSDLPHLVLVVSDHVDRRELPVYTNDARYVHPDQIQDLLTLFLQHQLRNVRGLVPASAIEVVVNAKDSASALAQAVQSFSAMEHSINEIQVASFLSNAVFGSSDPYEPSSSTLWIYVVIPLSVVVCFIGIVVLRRKYQQRCPVIVTDAINSSSHHPFKEEDDKSVSQQ